MEEVKLDPRLAALSPVVDELRMLRAFLEGGGAPRCPKVGAAERVAKADYGQLIRWIDETLNRIIPHIHAGRWPPVWWRLSGMNIDSVTRNIRRADAEGYFVDSVQGGFTPERTEIMASADRIDAAYRGAIKAGRARVAR